MKVLVVIDMQKDFIDGSLGTLEAVEMLPRAIQCIEQFDGIVLATRDTHTADYLQSQEGKHLPVEHCIEGSAGWALHPAIAPHITGPIWDKPTFGSVALGEHLAALHQENPLLEICLIGLCTDICVIANALLLKAFLPEVPITVDASCCAGVSPASHRQALEAMKLCQIQIVND